MTIKCTVPRWETVTGAVVYGCTYCQGTSGPWGSECRCFHPDCDHGQIIPNTGGTEPPIWCPRETNLSDEDPAVLTGEYLEKRSVGFHLGRIPDATPLDACLAAKEDTVHVTPGRSRAVMPDAIRDFLDEIVDAEKMVRLADEMPSMCPSVNIRVELKKLATKAEIMRDKYGR